MKLVPFKTSWLLGRYRVRLMMGKSRYVFISKRTSLCRQGVYDPWLWNVFRSTRALLTNFALHLCMFTQDYWSKQQIWNDSSRQRAIPVEARPKAEGLKNHSSAHLRISAWMWKPTSLHRWHAYNFESLHPGCQQDSVPDKLESGTKQNMEVHLCHDFRVLRML